MEVADQLRFYSDFVIKLHFFWKMKLCTAHIISLLFTKYFCAYSLQTRREKKEIFAHSSAYFPLFKKIFLVISEEDRDINNEREIYWLPPLRPLLWVEATTLACALTGNQAMTFLFDSQRATSTGSIMCGF